MNLIAALYVLGALTPDACREVHWHIDAIDAIMAVPLAWRSPIDPYELHGMYLKSLRNATGVFCG
jgi:hypothetical protein